MSVNSNPGNASASSGVVHKSQLFTANGTWNKPAKYIDGTCRVTGIGGGGSGRGSTTGSVRYGGDGGEYVQRIPVDVSAVSSVTITIGAGGASASAAVGNNGGTTSFGALVSLAGGIGGPNTSALKNTTQTGGAQGGGGTSLNAPADGVPGIFGSPRNNTVYSGGGGLILDDSGTSGGDVSDAMGGFGYGAGGASNDPSGAGADGAILVEWQEYA